MKMKRYCLIGTGALLCFLSLSAWKKTGDVVEYTMINVNAHALQGDAHLIRYNNDYAMLIDAGHHFEKHKLLETLRGKGVDKVDVVFITHPHKDHYGGLWALLENRIAIAKVYMNIPDREVCDQEIPWGCDYAEVLMLRDQFIKNNVKIEPIQPGITIPLGQDGGLEVLFVFDGIHTPVGRTDVNDLSAILLLRHKGKKVLFTGDLNKKLGEYLTNFPEKIDADVLKVPHHGTESAAGNDFFSAVSPKYALVPAPEHLWLSPRSERIRTWFSAQSIPVFVNGMHGDIEVVLKNGDISVFSEVSVANGTTER